MVEKLGQLEIYKDAIKLSDISWQIYQTLPKEFRFNIGKQLLNSADSIGANIAEGFGRFHFNDKIKFYYNARGSLFEVKHWIFLLHKRELIDISIKNDILNLCEKLGKQLNKFIFKSRKTNS